ncbi:ABC transporter ATP-binding protein [Sphingobium algorifonticola]|uniref:ATP-binding cassette domain-containing protein n=1 Tax=Sphingobium algorifonticola TaxID=2008318 RepID=A0A437J4U9_9SPHN|nr:ATP-binding cassette domain-containing protein [Sphingobium algorifonticola]RVT39767.1 ATP-binding cassette domain-containing protein [Sphingobium algorifonticola]
MPVALDLRCVDKAYGDRIILQDFSVTVDKGEHLLLLGPSGSGKTTLLNLIIGLLKPNRGTIMIAGEDVADTSHGGHDAIRRRHVAVIFQTLRLISAISIRDNLRLTQRLALGQADDKAIDHMLDALGIGHRASAQPRSLSQGEAQRAAIARALITRPTLIVADEPTSALDDGNAMRVADLLLHHAAVQGSSLIIATHDRRLQDFIPRSITLAQTATPST